MAAPAGEEAVAPRSRARLFALGAAALLAFGVLVALGNWQVARRAWKLELIERIETRVHAPPVAAPGPASWPAVSAASDEYRHVQVSGQYLRGRDTFTQAATSLGAGFWVLTPFRTGDSALVLINRGFVPGERSEASTRTAPPPEGPVTVIGLLRITEPGGGFLRSNDPAANRWYSRDVAAIAAARQLDREPGPGVAPYFIDAEASPALATPPIGGLTVIAFPNHHLIYALTWYGLALMLAGTTFYALREGWRAGRSPGAALPQEVEKQDAMGTDRGD